MATIALAVAFRSSCFVLLGWAVWRQAVGPSVRRLGRS